ncbi:MAG: peptidylprolyl isomerase [Crocinitomicaceae bacterium]|nr:peptidylprolyl isomerase [Crocinitomicaceae bacterium]MDG1777106.1 peptidylprolyl isomerase [Crocinitomicaceae bacterium]
MKLLLAFSITLLMANTSLSQGTLIDKVVAQVGDNVILLSEIQAQKLQAIQAGMKVTPEIDCQILEEIMFQYLLLNQAKLDSIDVNDSQVDAEMENRLRVIENQIGGRQEMETFYGKSVTQIKKEFRPIIKDQLLAQEMERQIALGITVTPREVDKFYKTIPLDSIPLINTQLSFQQIVHYPEITLNDKLRASDKLKEIRKNIIDHGKSFSTQARIHSMDPGSAKEGGKIEATRGMMVPQFEAAVFNLSPGGISEVFESIYGYHIVKLIERKGDDYTCQHILIIAEFANDALEASALKLDSCYKQIKAGEITWNDAVKKYSNDEATMQNKGIITNPITGEQTWDMEDLNKVDQQIYLLTDQMEKGEISQPNLYANLFDRKQGVRIVRLMERTTPHRANLKDDYSLIKRAAENDKKQKSMNKWITSKISNAYIRIDDAYKNCDFKNPWLPQ